MAQCVVCTQLAHVFCLSDKCFLCSACDKTIHEANVISRAHKRLPTCALCKRSAASVYCKEDEAALCDVCEREVHSANPLGVMHTVMPIDAAMASGLLGAGEQAAAPAAQPPAPQAPAAAAPAEDAQSSAHISSAPTSLTAELLNSSDASFVVPDMAAPSQPAAQAADAGLKGFKDFDALDFEATWFGNLDMGLDFSDILGNVEEELHGMVPTVDAMLSAPAPAAPAPAAKPTVPAPPMPAPFSLEDDFVVPSFLPDDLAEELNSAGLPPAAPFTAPTTTIGVKRSPSFVQLEPPAKVAALAPPAPILAPQPPPLVAPKPEPQAPSRPGPVVSGASLLTMNGANLTREQRVARYREKRKNRKFQKTIRYASRKAYAEVRPRIKGRFATKEEVEAWKAAKAAGLPDPTGISAANPAMA